MALPSTAEDFLRRLEAHYVSAPEGNSPGMETLLNIGAVANALKAPTKAEMAADPGKYDGSSFDPINSIVTLGAIIAFTGDIEHACELGVAGREFWRWYSIPGEGPDALAYMANTLGAPLNRKALSADQLKRLAGLVR